MRTRRVRATTAALGALVSLVAWVTPAVGAAAAQRVKVPPSQAPNPGQAKISPLGRLPHSTSSNRARAAQQRPRLSGNGSGGTALGTPLPLGSLALGTYVTNQFAKDGIEFSGQSPFITNDGSSGVNPTLSGSPLFRGNIVGTFVKPGTQTPTTVNAFSLYVGYIDSPGAVQMTVLGADGNQIGVLLATQVGFNQLYSTFPDAASFIVSSVADEPAGWEINTIQVGPIKTTYIAMGDSYSSGEGTDNFPWSKSQGTQCDTGPEAWPVQLANRENNSSTGATLDIGPNTLLACQGERSYQLNQPVNGEATSEIGQLSQYVAANGPPNLVTLTIGGNDLGFSSLLGGCFVGGTEVCLHEVDSLDKKVTSGRDGLIATLASVYAEVQSAAGSGTQVVVAGYPDLFPNPGGLGTAISVTFHCPWLRETLFPLLPFLPPVSPLLNTLLGHIQTAQAALNDDMASAATQAGVQFTPIPDSLHGHELCTGSPDINGLNPLKSGIVNSNRNAGHPNVQGQEAIAGAVGPQIGLASSAANVSLAAPAAPRRSTPSVVTSGPTRPMRASAALSVTAGPLLDGTVGNSYLDFLVATGGTGADTWAVTSGSLPPGLRLDSRAGTIAGTPSGAGTFAFTVRATDSSTPTPATVSASDSISVGTPTTLAIPATALPTATAGQPYSGALQAAGGRGALTWALTTGSLPAGLRLLPATGQIVGTPAAAVGTASFTVGVSDSSPTAETATADLSITVDPASAALTVTTTSLPAIQAGQDYTSTLNSTGGQAPTQWSVTAGSLPPGMSLDPATAVVSGAPTTPGTFSLTVQVADGSAPVSQTATASLSIQVNPAPPLAIATAQLLDGLEGSYYSSTLQAAGGSGADQWFVSSGSLPFGLSLNSTTGQITGVPIQVGQLSFTVTASDSAGQVAQQAYDISVSQLPLAVSSTLPPATVGQYYTGNITPSGGAAPYGWTVVSGALPTGLSFDPGTGAIVGTPTESGAFPLQVQVTDSTSPAQVVTAAVSLTVAAPPTLTISSTSLVAGVVGSPYTTGVGYYGGTGPYNWAVTSGSLPPGLNLDPGSGMITGSPTTQGSYPVTLQITDSTGPVAQVASASLTLVVDNPPTLGVVASALPSPTEGTFYQASLAATGGTTPYNWSLTGGSLPPGLSLDAASGQIAGVPTSQGPSSFTVTVTDSTGSTPASASATFTVSVDPAPPLKITTIGLDDIAQGTYAVEQLSAGGGVAPYTWTVVNGRLPAGLQLTSDGYIFGTPTHFGSSTFTVRATDSATPTTQSSKATLTLDVLAEPLSPPSFIADQPPTAIPLTSSFSYAFAATGNPAPTFAITSGHVPAGLHLAKNGLLTGTPTHDGTSTFQVTASNGRTPPAVSPVVSITVVPPPVITGFSPAEGPPGTTVTITGSHLANLQYLYFTGSYATIVKNTASTVVTTVPSFAGTGAIYLATAGGSAVSPASFTVDPSPPPTITSLSPIKAAPGTTLTIKGTNLMLAQQVQFNGATVYGFIKDWASQIQVTVPSGIQAGTITVITQGGSVTSTQTFTPTG